MRVLVIPEDFRKDQYVLKPIISAMLEKGLGQSNVRVRVCTDPLLGGVGEALKWANIQSIIQQYKGMVDLFLLCVDRDGKNSRRESLDNLEAKAREVLGRDRLFIAENAWQELEVWLLAGHDLPKDWTWADIRSETDPKERYYKPFAQQQDVMHLPSQGRKALAERAAKRYDRIRQLCPEDIQVMEQKIKTWLS